MRKWPDNNEPADFEYMGRDVCKAIRFAYKIQRKNQGRDIPWKGLDNGKTAHSLSPTEQLCAENLAYSLEEQGRDALSEIIGVALQLGIEQGKRIMAPEIKVLKMLSEAHSLRYNKG